MNTNNRDVSSIEKLLNPYATPPSAFVSKYHNTDLSLEELKTEKEDLTTKYYKTLKSNLGFYAFAEINVAYQIHNAWDLSIPFFASVIAANIATIGCIIYDYRRNKKRFNEQMKELTEYINRNSCNSLSTSDQSPGI